MIRAFHPPIEAEFKYCVRNGHLPCRVLATIKLLTNLAPYSTRFFLVESIDGKYQDWVHYSMLRILSKESEDRAYEHDLKEAIG